jgi:hypothetical protein
MKFVSFHHLDEGDTLLRSVGFYIGHTALHPRKRHFLKLNRGLYYYFENVTPMHDHTYPHRIASLRS